ncbi:4,5-DOPA dioxygenase extradiol [Plebeiibacterium sediminum]|uniref:4,5-DOPA dioxygenase extradiol n=1 Tax=Plebeiibacterium sediminum TaxID=2992112 RepID=A0AAE3M8G7_9BACT|nr:4,5-DOPA dioxygenase extradiol [Plebeiobacterium sediminum]MCW3789179.1 4,5-DOPA dioxygenase extradiol [Plebeiobacterium sediminum]
MNRKTFLKTLMVATPATLIGMKLNALNKLADSFGATPKMPALFLGHGSPMNAIEENEFVQGFRKVSSEIEVPKAIIVVSAHWESRGTKVTAMEHPQTIHDFGGFTKALYEVQYPAPGSPELAKETQSLIKSTDVHLDDKWGLDHGAWSVIRHMYPKANIPVIQLSLDYYKTPREHYELAKELAALREKGILIVGSGNLVHNLGRVDWQRLNENFAFDWAQEATNKMNNFILNGDHDSLINYSKQGKEFQLSIPTPEHFLPLLYVLGLQEKNESISLFNDEPVAGSLSMTSVKIG